MVNDNDENTRDPKYDFVHTEVRIHDKSGRFPVSSTRERIDEYRKSLQKELTKRNEDES